MKGSVIAGFHQSRMLEFSGGTRPPCFSSIPGLILGWSYYPILLCTSLLLSLHSLSGLGRNIILTTMPAGTKLIAGNKPVSFLTAQQLQQLQQQGQATQVRSKASCWPYQAFLSLFAVRSQLVSSLLIRHSPFANRCASRRSLHPIFNRAQLLVPPKQSPLLL